MTGMCATRLGLKDRGILKPGAAADVAVFDPRTVKDEATFADPHRHPTGIPWVVVNGALVVDRNSFTAAATGRVLTPSGG
jgi:N-acyl-D-aspartate/D-glutamate deacylase